MQIRVTGAHEEPNFVPIPTLSKAEVDEVPGSTTYRVDLQAVVRTPQEFEQWRLLLGKTIEIGGN